MNGFEKLQVKLPQEPFEWVRCKSCNQEWTPQSINKFGLCPRCHKKKLGIFDVADHIQEILERFSLHFPDEFQNWNGAFDTLPSWARNEIIAVCKTKENLNREEVQMQKKGKRRKDTDDE